MKKDVTGFVTFIGVDLHKCTVTLRAVRQDGELIGHLKISTKSVERIEQWINDLPGPKWMAVEACPFVEWFIDRYTPCVDRMDIADATELALRRGKRRKNDPNDALDIASRLARGECPLGYIADPQLMQLRKLGRHWRQLSRSLAKAKQSMKSMLNAANIRGPQFDGPRAHRWFLSFGGLLQPVQRLAFGNYLDQILLGSGLRRWQNSPLRPVLSHVFRPFTRRTSRQLALKREQKPTVRLLPTGVMLAKVRLKCH